MTLVRRAFTPRHRCISQQPPKHGTPDTTPHFIGKAPPSGTVQSSVVLVLVYGFLLVRQWMWYHQYGQERWLTYMRAYSPRRNLNNSWYSGLYERLDQNSPCSLSRNWVVVFSSTNKAGSMIQSWTHPKWMHTYTFNFWAIPTLGLFQKIQSQCSAVDLSSALLSNWDKDQLPLGNQVFP